MAQRHLFEVPGRCQPLLGPAAEPPPFPVPPVLCPCLSLSSRSALGSVLAQGSLKCVPAALCWVRGLAVLPVPAALGCFALWGRKPLPKFGVCGNFGHSVSAVCFSFRVQCSHELISISSSHIFYANTASIYKLLFLFSLGWDSYKYPDQK